MRITYQGRGFDVINFRDAQVVFEGLTALAQYDEAGAADPADPCESVLEDALTRAEQLRSPSVILDWLTSNIYEQPDLGAYQIPYSDSVLDIPFWEGDPVLSQALDAGAGGYLVPAGEGPELVELSRRVIQASLGNCEPVRITNWGLVGALGLSLGGLALIGGLFTMGKKKP